MLHAGHSFHSGRQKIILLLPNAWHTVLHENVKRIYVDWKILRKVLHNGVFLASASHNRRFFHINTYFSIIANSLT